ncbi:MAG: helix-turn-helix transcriptional regulator [Novosphingobium sp.]
MALSSLDERDLLIPLAEGIREDPMWDTFLKRLRQRTGATWACLLVQMTPTAHLPPITRVAAARTGLAEPDFDRLSSLGLIPYAALRSGRVYALEEMLDFDDPDAPSRQRAALKEAGIAHARFIRIVSRAENNAWIVLLSERRPFDADDSALLSAIAPHLSVALDTLGELGAQQLRATIAEQALKMLGIGQLALDREGRVILTDDLASEILGARGGTRLNLSTDTAQTLARDCADMAQAPANSRRVVTLGKTGAPDLLLRPLPAPKGTAVAAIGAIRQPQKRNRGPQPRIVAQLLGLSEREAALAEAMSRGETILDAGAQLQLTPETARNYTKRAYAKTGASGQADLVRQVLTGLAPLA